MMIFMVTRLHVYFKLACDKVLRGVASGLVTGRIRYQLPDSVTEPLIHSSTHPLIH